MQVVTSVLTTVAGIIVSIAMRIEFKFQSTSPQSPPWQGGEKGVVNTFTTPNNLVSNYFKYFIFRRTALPGVPAGKGRLYHLDIILGTALKFRGNFRCLEY